MMAQQRMQQQQMFNQQQQMRAQGPNPQQGNVRMGESKALHDAISLETTSTNIITFEPFLKACDLP